MNKKHYRTIFISEIHLWNPKNQSDMLIKFLDSIKFENLIIIWDFIDYRQLSRFWKWWEKEQKTLDYINNLSKKWVHVTYIQWNHDRELKCWNGIQLHNITILRDMYYKTLKWQTYYITHWDRLDWVNKDWNKIWQIWSIVFWLLFKIESLRNKSFINDYHLSIIEKFEERIKRNRMPEKKIKNKIDKFSKNLNCEWIILWHFHIAKHYKINWLNCFISWDRIKHYSAVVEDNKWDLELIFYK